MKQCQNIVRRSLASNESHEDDLANQLGRRCEDIETALVDAAAYCKEALDGAAQA